MFPASINRFPTRNDRVSSRLLLHTSSNLSLLKPLYCYREVQVKDGLQDRILPLAYRTYMNRSVFYVISLQNHYGFSLGTGLV